MGLYEPRSDAREIAPEQVNATVDVALLLGIAFERHRGYRIGHGKGYFDRFLADKSFTTIGLALESQVVEHLPHEAHDVPMRILVTEDRIYHYED